MKKFILILISLPFILCVCKDEDPKPKYFEPDPELKEWGLYQKGTWWIYEEENTHVRDSVWVDTVITTIFKPDPRNLPNRYEKNYQSVTNGNYAYTIGSNGADVYFIQLDNNNQEFGGRGFLFRYPLVKGTRVSLGSVSYWAEIDTIYDSIKVGNKYFYNVPRVFDFGNPAFNNDTTYFYSARNFGIIRKEFPELNQVWNLVKFNIIQ